MKQGSNQAIMFFVMESPKDWYRGGDNTKPINKLLVGSFGAIAGAASVFGNTPIDVVKTRMQVSHHMDVLIISLKNRVRGWMRTNIKAPRIALCKSQRMKVQKRKYLVEFLRLIKHFL